MKFSLLLGLVGTIAISQAYRPLQPQVDIFLSMDTG